jgi:glycosyltransferase domain-containing protein
MLASLNEFNKMIKVAILIPTMNRSGFLIRQLKYYSSLSSPHPVYIGDASNREHCERTKQAIEKLKDQITIHYYQWPEHNDRQTMNRLGDVAKESYCAYNGDDDFLVPNSLSKCAEFLERNPDYRTAQGKAVIFSLKETGPFGTVSSVGKYRSNNKAEEDSGVDRILNFAKNYWVSEPSVHRRKEFVEDSSIAAEIQDRSFGELLRCFTSITKGKSKFIYCLHLIRQGHDSQPSTQFNTFEWLTGSEWVPSFTLFIDSVIGALIKVQNLTEKEARNTVNKANWSYLFISIKRSYIKKNNNQILFREWLRGFMILRKIVNNVRLVRSKFTAKKGELSLPALLNPSSPYHKDFIPIYNVITDLNGNL